MWLRRSTVGAVALATGMMCTDETAEAFSCAGPSFWHVQRRAKIIIHGVVVQHIGQTPNGRPRDFVVKVKEVLRGTVVGDALTFEGGDGIGRVLSAAAFPVAFFPCRAVISK
jgi:hypothetical protein